MLVGFLFYPEAACWLVLWLSYGIVYCYQKQHVYRLYINANRFLAWSNTLANLAIPARCTSTGSRLLWLRRFFSGKPKCTHLRHNGYFSFSISPRYICWIDKDAITYFARGFVGLAIPFKCLLMIFHPPNSDICYWLGARSSIFMHMNIFLSFWE